MSASGYGIKMMDLDNGHIKKKKKCLTRMQIKLQQKKGGKFL